MAIINHLIHKAEWEAANPTGEVRPASLAEEGFIHCSSDEPQLLAVAQRLYSGRDDMLVLEVDTERLASPVKHEPSRSGEIYPHIYGPLNTDAVLRVRRLGVGADGRFHLLKAELAINDHGDE